ncbi:MAG: GntR family transcriptional regulator [Acidobacteriota bacterium]
MHNAPHDPAVPETPRQLRQWVVERLRSEIVRGQIQAGEWLRQEKLARALGISQTPVREALKQLAAEGLLEYEPYRGIRVVHFTAEDVEDVYAGRVASEGRAARYAAERITTAELLELEAIQREIEQCEMPHELPRYRELNRRFHLAIIRASRRPYLIRSLTQLWGAFPTMLWGSVPDTAKASAPGRDLPDLQEHEALLAALQARDPEAAERALRRHIESSGKALAAAIRAGRR